MDVRPAPPPNLQAAAAPVGALHVLIVENHSDTRQGVRIFLGALGYQASGAETVAQALAMSEDMHFDVLLSDISLPDGDGWDLLARLAARGRRPAHAFAMSGLGGAVDQARSREAGFELHLVKPFAPEELEEALHRAATQRLASGPAPLFHRPAADRPAPGVPLAQQMHDGLCQHLVAAGLWQGSLVRRLENMPLPEAASEARQVSRLLEEALAETRALMRTLRAP